VHSDDEAFDPGLRRGPGRYGDEIIHHGVGIFLFVIEALSVNISNTSAIPKL